MQLKRFSTYLALAALFFVGAVAPAYALDVGGNTGTDVGGNTTTGVDSGTQLQNPLHNINSLEDLITAIITMVTKIGVYVLILMMVWVGFLFVAARGQEEKIRDARTALMWTIVGGLILLGANAISLAIQATANSL